MQESELTDIGTELAKEQEKESDSNPISLRGLAAAAAVAAGLIDAKGAVTDEVLERCVVIDGLTEVVEKMTLQTEDGAPGPGTIAEYVDGLFDQDGKRVGTITGSALVLDMLPHMWQLHRNVVELEDGTIEAEGIVDATATVQGITCVIPVTGVSGRYEGMKGFRTLVLPEGEHESMQYEVTIVLC